MDHAAPAALRSLDKLLRAFQGSLKPTVYAQTQCYLDDVPVEQENHLAKLDRPLPNILQLFPERQQVIPQQNDTSCHYNQITGQKNGGTVNGRSRVRTGEVSCRYKGRCGIDERFERLLIHRCLTVGEQCLDLRRSRAFKERNGKRIPDTAALVKREKQTESGPENRVVLCKTQEKGKTDCRRKAV